jgi:phosphoglycolate phosphatase-like HAD superfamily hydrolase
MRSICFDIDGTLVDTRELNLRAYAQVGVEIPDDAWGRRWQEWLPEVVGDPDRAIELHERKTSIYVDLILASTVADIELPCARIARELSHQEHGPVRVYLLTGASTRPVLKIIQHLDIHPNRLFSNLDYAARQRYLEKMPGGTPYLDDLAETVEQLRVDVPHIRPIRYTGQTYEQLPEIL